MCRRVMTDGNPTESDRRVTSSITVRQKISPRKRHKALARLVTSYKRKKEKKETTARSQDETECSPAIAVHRREDKRARERYGSLRRHVSMSRHHGLARTNSVLQGNFALEDPRQQLFSLRLERYRSAHSSDVLLYAVGAPCVRNRHGNRENVSLENNRLYTI